MRMSESIKEITVALIAAQSELPTIIKDKLAKGDKFSYRYVSLDTVMPEALAILNKNGMALTQTVGTAEGGGTTLSTTILHSSGEWISDTQPLLLVKLDPQGQGSAITYARRYGLMAMLGLVADDDDDGAAASPRDTAPQSRTQSRQRPQERADAAPLIDAYERKARELEKGEQQVRREIERSSKEQHKFIRSLVGKMFDGDEQAQVSCIAVINAHAVNDAVTEIHLTPLSKGEASAMIDGLQKMQRTEPQPKLEPLPVAGDPGPTEPSA
ncbi:hypothetical protein LCGC14_1103860 [marine sediment metagenome]|uniref:ERF family protein n=1 Tax=marine sediment metagenome TaxID=412755 RepID=A0A0F9QEY6_9ZZZZ